MALSSPGTVDASIARVPVPLSVTLALALALAPAPALWLPALGVLGVSKGPCPRPFSQAGVSGAYPGSPRMALYPLVAPLRALTVSKVYVWVSTVFTLPIFRT